MTQPPTGHGCRSAAAVLAATALLVGALAGCGGSAPAGTRRQHLHQHHHQLHQRGDDRRERLRRFGRRRCRAAPGRGLRRRGGLAGARRRVRRRTPVPGGAPADPGAAALLGRGARGRLPGAGLRQLTARRREGPTAVAVRPSRRLAHAEGRVLGPVSAAAGSVSSRVPDVGGRRRPRPAPGGAPRGRCGPGSHRWGSRSGRRARRRRPARGRPAAPWRGRRRSPVDQAPQGPRAVAGSHPSRERMSRAAGVTCSARRRSARRRASASTWRSTMRASCSGLSASKSTTSSRRLRNSGLNAARTAAMTPSRWTSRDRPGSTRNWLPRFDVSTRIVLRKSTVRPWPSVRRPSSRTCRSTSKTSGWAFSTSSSSTTLYGAGRTASVSCHPTRSRRTRGARRPAWPPSASRRTRTCRCGPWPARRRRGSRPGPWRARSCRPGRAEEQERAVGRSGSEMPARARRTASETAPTASDCPTRRSPSTSSMRRSLAVSPSSRRPTGMPVQAATTAAMSSGPTRSPTSGSLAALPRSSAAWASASSRSSAGDLLVLDAGGRRVVDVAVGPLEAGAGVVELLLELTDAVQAGLLRLPPGGEGGQLLGPVGQVGAQPLQPVEGGRVGLGRQGHLLHAQAVGGAPQRVDLLRGGVDLHAQPGRGLVDEVDGLVGQLAAGDVPVGERGGGHERRVGDLDAVVGLVALVQPAQDGDGGRARWARPRRPAGSAARGRRPLDPLAVLGERGGADQAQLAAGEHRLEHVARVEAALAAGGPGADDGVQLVDEGDDLAVGAADLVEHGLQPLLELPAVLRPGEHGPQVEADEAAPAQRLGQRRRRRCAGRGPRPRRSCRHRARR